jgi:hypothetical protein
VCRAHHKLREAASVWGQGGGDRLGRCRLLPASASTSASAAAAFVFRREGAAGAGGGACLFVDVGAAPGGWTDFLAEHGAQVQGWRA